MTAFALKWLAIASMLIDHIGVVFVPRDTLAYIICRSVGRLAFPLFAFMIAEGYFYTKNYTKYFFRMAVFAVVSEVPFDLMVSGDFISWQDQSVFVTFAIALAGLYFFDRFAASDQRFSALLALLTSAFAAELAHSDYGAFGILIVFIFYFYRGRPRMVVTWFSATVILFSVLNAVNAMPSSRSVTVSLIGGFALFALIPILLYNKKKKKGYKAPFWQYFFYFFYPAHMLILVLLKAIGI